MAFITVTDRMVAHEVRVEYRKSGSLATSLAIYSALQVEGFPESHSAESVAAAQDVILACAAAAAEPHGADVLAAAVDVFHAADRVESLVL